MTKGKNIEELKRVLIKDNWEYQDVVYIMSVYRLLLEEDNNKDKFKYLNLYCNWTLHTEISGSSTAYQILEYAAEAFRNSADEHDYSIWVSDAITIGLSFHKLQTDILQVGKEYNINESMKLSNPDIWSLFGTILIQILANKQLKFPDPIENKKVKAIYDSIIAKAKLAPAATEICEVIGLEFKDEEYSAPFKNNPGYEGPHIEIFTVDSVRRDIHIIISFQFVTEEQVKNALPTLKPK